MENAAVGIFLTLTGGVIGSSTLMPVKYVRVWKWENTWLAYSSFAYFIFPWLSALLTVPHLISVYAGVEGKTLFLTAVFGLGWGLGVVLYGLALDIVGLSISSGIILGSSVALGSLIPLLLIGTELALSSYGIRILSADAVMIAGVLLCAWAGSLRQKGIAVAESENRGARFLSGILICFLGGMLSPLLNVAFTFGAPITRRALDLGATPFNASNGVWALCVSAGSLPSIFYCLFKLKKNHSWSFYSLPHSRKNLVLCFAMGVFFIASTILYGAAAGKLGFLGPVVGWPIYISALILGNNFWGWYTDEWKSVKGLPVWTMYAGITLQVVAMVLLGIAKKS